MKITKQSHCFIRSSQDGVSVYRIFDLEYAYSYKLQQLCYVAVKDSYIDLECP